MSPRPPHDSPPEEETEDRGTIIREYRRAMAQYSFLGLQFGFATAIGGGLGWWLDGKFDTRPVLMIVGVLLGFTAAIKDFVKAVKKAKKLGDKDETKPSEPA